MSNFQPGAGAAGTYNPDNLLAGDAVPAVTRSVVIDTGNLPRGAVLGRITATGKYVLSASAAADGSQTPTAILAEKADATAADVTTVAYETGEFNGAALTLGAGHTLASIAAGLRDLNIHIKTNQPA